MPKRSLRAATCSFRHSVIRHSSFHHRWPMRCLITGVTGFVGRHLAAALTAAGHECVGVARDPGPADIPVHTADLIDPAAAEAVLRTVRPEWVFHLAGYADNGRSYREPAAAWDGNLGVTRSLYDAVASTGLRP